jgi:hypothetical protein
MKDKEEEESAPTLTLPPVHPNIPFDPVAHGVRNRSFVQYDDDQDMDSRDTHSISSMLSGHDPIPEMTDMLEQSIEKPG